MFQVSNEMHLTEFCGDVFPHCPIQVITFKSIEFSYIEAYTHGDLVKYWPEFSVTQSLRVKSVKSDIPK